ncbi:MAG: exonuclease domain-containing protein [Pleomorphochaeta sp.]
MNYVALDFETANANKGGAASIGMAKFNEEGEVIDTYYSLICPKVKYFDPSMTRVHQLSANDCLISPTFDKLWDDIENFMADDIIVAHNAKFDYSVLQGCLESYDLNFPKNVFYCTLQISRKKWPDLRSHKLTYLSEVMELNYRAHHALDDAINCGKIFKLACGDKTFNRFDLINYLDYELKVPSKKMVDDEYLF